MTLSSVIQLEFDEWPYRHVEQAIFGTDEPAQIAEIVDSFCRNELGSPINDYLFYKASIGSVHGLKLLDGRQVVLKVNSKESDLEHLVACQEVHGFLYQSGFPLPEPLLPHKEMADGFAHVERYLESEVRHDGHSAGVRWTMAGTLVQLVEHCRSMKTPHGLRRAFLSKENGDRLWPPPHDNRFNFQTTSDGAEWIDELGTRALKERSDEAGLSVIGHSDWCIAHVRFKDDVVSAIYDSDSFAFEPESWIVGSAANSFTTDWTVDPPPAVPSAEEALGFIDDYEGQRSTPFKASERRATFAALVYAAAYGARCEHSDVLTDMGRSHPRDVTLSPIPVGTFRHLLKNLTKHW